MAHTVRSAIEEGAREYNFLLGNEDYKSRFASAYRPVETVVLARICDTAQLVMRVDRGIRRVADRLPRGCGDRCRGVDRRTRHRRRRRRRPLRKSRRAGTTERDRT